MATAISNSKCEKTCRTMPGSNFHFALAGGAEGNSADPFVANLDQNDDGHYLKVTANADGSFSIYNPRNKYTNNYAAK